MSNSEPNIFGRAVKTAFYVSRGNLGDFFSKNVYFSDFEKNSDVEQKFFGIRAKIIHQGGQNCIPSVQRNVLGFKKT